MRNDKQNMLFQTELRKIYKNLQSSANVCFDEWINVFLNEYQKNYEDRANKGEDYDLGSARELAISTFIYKMKKLTEEAEQLLFYEKEIKPLTKK